MSDKLSEFDENTKKIEKELEEKSKEWNTRYQEVCKNIKGNIHKIPEIQSDILSYMQMVTDEIRSNTLALKKLNTQLKKIKKQKFEFYSTTYQINIKNDNTKKSLTEYDLAKIQYRFDLIETHIDYLSQTLQNLDSLKFSVKNRLELLNILGLD